MAEKVFIIHPSCMSLAVARPKYGQTSEEAARAMEYVADVIANATHLVEVDTMRHSGPDLNGDVYVVRKGEYAYVTPCIAPGDIVTICGAYRNICVDGAADFAMQAGAIVNVSLKGTVF